MTYCVVGGAFTFIYVNVNSVANERHLAAPARNTLPFESFISINTERN